MNVLEKKKYDRARYLANRKSILERNRIWALHNHEIILAVDRRYKANHMAELKIKGKLYRDNNPDLVYEIQRKWRLKNLPKCVLWQRKWRKDHPGYSSEQIRRYRVANPEICREGSVRWKARKRGADVSSKETSNLIRKWKKLSEFECSYCHIIFPTNGMNIDHIIPLSKGGLHSPENICRACSDCNRRKGCKMLEEFLLCR